MLQKRKVLPPLDYLLAFEASATTGSFARASENLNISETAISRKVRLLEQHYNLPLFVRGHRSITLTAQGATLLKSVSTSLDMLRDASEEMFARHQTNTVTLAATNSVAALWLMPRLHKFNRANAQVKIMLVASDSDAECLADTVDLAILRGDSVDEWPGFEATQLFGETVFPVCAPQYLQQNPGSAQLRQLPGLDLIEVSSTHTEWMDWKNWLGKQAQHNVTFDRAAVFNTYPLAIQAAVDGLGIALGWSHLVDHLLESGKLVRPVPKRYARTNSGYYLLKNKKKKPFAELDIVESWLLEASASRKRFSMRADYTTVGKT